MVAAPEGTVTLLFSDIEGSTRLLRRAGEAYGELLLTHRRLLRRAFEAHGGYEVDTEGDAFFVAFWSANEAIAAAESGQKALAVYEWPEGQRVWVRMGLPTGEPRLLDGRYIGLDVHQAARVMAAGHGGQVLLSQSTRDLLDERAAVRDLGEHRLKDLSAPQHLYQLQIEGLPAEFPALKTLENRPTNLPVQQTPLIGRARELREIEGLLRDEVRLVTLTGPGGIGKTRLALQAAADAIERFRDGVYFVALASVRDPALVIPSIAERLGLREQPGEPLATTVSEYLREKSLLLVLDNLEQILAATPGIAALLAVAPGARVLATSREPLRLSGEQVYDVPPLGLPHETDDLEGVATADAVRLFAARATAARADFVLSADNAAVVGELVTRLDGLPLAVELAAARVRVLPPQAILDRIEQRLKLLTGGNRDQEERQQTLAATIQWSYDLLTPNEQSLFARLAVFVSGCRIDDAEAVCNHDGSLGTDSFDDVASLVEKSLLRQRQDPNGEPRYWMLETIREYALASLAARNELDELRRQHAAHFLLVAEEAETEARTGDQAACFERLDADVSNLRAAFEEGTPEIRMRLASALWDHWAARGEISTGLHRLEEALTSTRNPPPRALVGLSMLRHLAAFDGARVLEDAQNAARVAELLGDEFALAQAWNLIGRIQSSGLGQISAGEQSWNRALAHAERGGYRNERADIIGWLMVMALFGPLPTDEGIERCITFFERAGDDLKLRAIAQVERAALEAMRGEFEVARDLFARGRSTFRELGLNVWAANTAQEGFYVEMLAGDPRTASSMLRASYQALEEMGVHGFLSTIAALLAHALYAEGDDAESEQFSLRAQETAASDDVFSQMLWRTARAKVYARHGRLAGAEALAREAVELTKSCELLNGKADVFSDLAEVLLAAGRVEEARPCLLEAERLYSQKGNLVSLARTRDHLERLSTTGE